MAHCYKAMAKVGHFTILALTASQLTALGSSHLVPAQQGGSREEQRAGHIDWSLPLSSLWICNLRGRVVLRVLRYQAACRIRMVAGVKPAARGST